MTPSPIYDKVLALDRDVENSISTLYLFPVAKDRNVRLLSALSDICSNFLDLRTKIVNAFQTCSQENLFQDILDSTELIELHFLACLNVLGKSLVTGHLLCSKVPLAMQVILYLNSISFNFKFIQACLFINNDRRLNSSLWKAGIISANSAGAAPSPKSSAARTNGTEYTQSAKYLVLHRLNSEPREINRQSTPLPRASPTNGERRVSNAQDRLNLDSNLIASDASHPARRSLASKTPRQQEITDIKCTCTCHLIVRSTSTFLFNLAMQLSITEFQCAKNKPPCTAEHGRQNIADVYLEMVREISQEVGTEPPEELEKHVRGITNIYQRLNTNHPPAPELICELFGTNLNKMAKIILNIVICQRFKIKNGDEFLSRFIQWPVAFPLPSLKHHRTSHYLSRNHLPRRIASSSALLTTNAHTLSRTHSFPSSPHLALDTTFCNPLNANARLTSSIILSTTDQLLSIQQVPKNVVESPGLPDLFKSSSKMSAASQHAHLLPPMLRANQPEIRRHPSVLNLFNQIKKFDPTKSILDPFKNITNISSSQKRSLKNNNTESLSKLSECWRLTDFNIENACPFSSDYIDRWATMKQEKTHVFSFSPFGNSSDLLKHNNNNKEFKSTRKTLHRFGFKISSLQRSHLYTASLDIGSLLTGLLLDPTRKPGLIKHNRISVNDIEDPSQFELRVYKCLLDVDPADNDDTMVLDKHKRIIGATKGELVKLLISTRPSATDFLTCLLNTHPLFMSPSEFAKLLEYYWNTSSIAKSLSDASASIQPKILEILHTWVDNFSDQFVEYQDLSTSLMNFAFRMLNKDSPGSIQIIYKLIEVQLLNRLSRNPVHCYVHLTKHHGTHAVCFSSLSPTEVAQQITVIEQDFFQKIKSHELLNLSQMDPVGGAKMMSITESVEWSNHLATWIQNEILDCSELTKRAQFLNRFIYVARNLLFIKNFNSAIWVLAALEKTNVSRLKHTWNMLPLESWRCFEELKRFFDDRCKYYRDELSNVTPPCIPCLGYYFDDMITLNQLLPDVLENTELINWRKMENISKLLQNIKAFQQQKYTFEAQQAIIHYIQDYQISSRDELYSRSLALEA